MKRRSSLQAQALFFSLATVCSGFLMAHFFYTGPANLAPLEATAQATEAIAQPIAEVITAKTLNPQDVHLPAGFHPQWEARSLDHGAVNLQVLSRPFLISQTQNGLGSEAFDYAAFIFEQM